jgi:hypothetical protein
MSTPTLDRQPYDFQPTPRRYRAPEEPARSLSGLTGSILGQACTTAEASRAEPVIAGLSSRPSGLRVLPQGNGTDAGSEPTSPPTLLPCPRATPRTPPLTTNPASRRGCLIPARVPSLRRNFASGSALRASMARRDGPRASAPPAIPNGGQKPQRSGAEKGAAKGIGRIFQRAISQFFWPLRGLGQNPGRAYCLHCKPLKNQEGICRH